MDNKLKGKILGSIHTIYLQLIEEQGDNIDYKDVDDIFNIVKILESWEELAPDIRDMLNKKATNDKWKNKSKEW